jgi:dihydroflavonol-4-reductase
MKVLVTGSSGFLGGWLVRRLVAEGHDVRTLLRKPDELGHLTKLGVSVATGDITNASAVRSACDGVETVFHLAGLIAYSRAERLAMEKVNVGGTRNVVEACIDTRVGKLIYLSSVAAIGASFTQSVLNETSPCTIQHLNLGYFETKRQAEVLVREAVLRGEIKAVILNPSTIYGAGDASKGSRTTQLKVARGEFRIYPPGGVNVVAVEDVIDGIMAAWQKGQNGQRYILASENLLLVDVFKTIARTASVPAPRWGLPKSAIFALAYASEAARLVGLPGPFSIENAWTSTMYHWFDSSKAQSELGLKFRPSVWAIENSVRHMRDQGLLK